MKPVPDRLLPELEPYWEGLDRGALLVPRCDGCHRFRWPPRPRCPACGGVSFAWTEVPRQATLYSWTTVGRAFLPGFAEEVPYTVGIVELTKASSVRMVGQVLGVPPAELQVGMRLRASLQRGERVTLCQWVPEDPAADC